MDECSDADTIVEESLDIYDSPSILKGLFHFRMETKTAEESKMYNNDGKNSYESATADCPVVNDYDEAKVSSVRMYEATNPDSDPPGTDSTDCQSEMSISILTSRVPEKRMHPTDSPPESPVFAAHVLSSKFPRLHDVTSSNGAEETLCDDPQSSMGALHFEPSPTLSSVTTCPSQHCVYPLIPDLSQTVSTPNSSKSESHLPKDTQADNSECQAVTTPIASRTTDIELEGTLLNPSKIQAVTTPTASKSESLELEDNPPNPSECQALATPTATKSINLDLEDNPPIPSECQALTTPTATKSISLDLEDNPPIPSECQALTTPTATKSINLDLEDNPPIPSECQALTTPTATNSISLDLEDNPPISSECQALTTPTATKSINLDLEDNPPIPSECQALTTPTATKSINLDLEDNPPNPSECQAVTTPTASKNLSLDSNDKPSDPSECQAVITTQSRSTRLVHKDTHSEPPHQHHLPKLQLLPNTKTPDGIVLTRKMPSPVPNKSQSNPSEQLISGTQLLPRSKTPMEIAGTRSSSFNDETLSVCVSKEEDEVVIEIKKMQQDLRQLMQLGRDKNYDAGSIKKGLQDMQGKLRQLGTKQQEQRRQLSVIMKQQAAPSSSSQSKLQQQEVKAKLQHMARRQQQLLKLLQSHKDLAATLHTQCAAHRALQHQPADTSQEHRNLPQDASGFNRSTHKMILQTKATVCNLTPTTKMKDVAKSSSVEVDTPVVLPQSITRTASQNTCRIPPQSKETRSFKPPFRAKQALRMPSAQQNTAIILADSSTRPGPQLESLGAEKTSSSAGPEAQTHTVSLGSGTFPPESPPFSQSSDISNGNFLPDKEGNEREKPINPKDNTTQDKPSKKRTSIQISYPHLNQSSDNIRRDTETNYGTINKDNQDCTNRALHSLLPNSKGIPRSNITVISNSTFGSRLDTVSKTQIGTTLSGCQPLTRGRSSAAGQSTVSLKARQQAGPPATDIIISEKPFNISQKIRVQKSTHHKKSITTPTAIAPTMTHAPVAPVGLQHTAPKTPASPQEAQKVASTNPHGATLAANNPVGSSMFRTAPHSGTVSASSIQSQVSKTMELIRSPVTPAADKSRDNLTIVGNPQRVTHQTLPSIHIASLRPSTQQKEPGEDERVPSLMDLLQAKLIQAGENVLTIKSKKHILGTASLKADGTVSPADTMINIKSGSLPQMVSLMKHRSLNWITNNPKIWKSVFYKETPLTELHSDYNDLIRSDPSQTVLKRRKLSPNLQNTQAAITMTTTSSILQPAIVTTNSAHMSTPSISKRQKPVESRDPVSSISNDPASSSGLSLTSSRLDPTLRGHDPIGHEIHPPSGRETVSRALDKNPNSLGPVSRGDNSVSSRSHDFVSSLKRVLLISDDELMPSSWGMSSYFWSAGNSDDAIINPEWIKDIDVWS